ncbi:hypothetical protein FTX61_17730 [Nitriliruptoraceae bacterium ZYF776]|nr:hypothetical protein [Profundirhabdus halotolerans]
MDPRLPPLPPSDALAQLLPPDVDLDVGWRHEAARPVWLGVVWGRLGRGDLAHAHLDRVRLPTLWPWVAAERGRLLRELGLHDRAEALEFPALVQATDPVDEVMLRVSLTADAVGAGDVDRAVRRLAAARDALTRCPEGPRLARQRLRYAWVDAEVAFLTGRRPTGDGLPVLGPDGEVVWPADHRWGTTFHAAKGLLFGGVVTGEPRLLDLATAQAPPVLRWAIELARADAGRAGALEAARRAWATIVPPPGSADEVAATPAARRLAS